MLFQVIAALVTATAVFSWINRRFLHLPNNVAMLSLGTVTAVGLLSLELMLPSQSVSNAVSDALGEIDFYEAVMQWMLAFLLFAGAVTIDWKRLRSRSAVIALLASGGVVFTAFAVAALLWVFVQLIGAPVNFAWCFVFGALIAPTDPVAALATLQSVDLPKQLETEISGEALFNDGIAVVVFAVALELATRPSEGFGLLDAGLLLGEEAGGGVLLGLASGFVAFHAFRTVNDYPNEVLFSLALVMGTYALAQLLHVSGPLAVVVAGILIGNRGAPQAMSEQTRTYFFGFWQLTDHMLNGILFTLLGLEVLILHLQTDALITGAVAIPIVLAARYTAVSGATLALSPWLDFGQGTPSVLTWSAIRGAISAALALSLPQSDARPYVLAGAYGVILFSVIVQTLTLPHVVKRSVRTTETS